MNNNQITLLDLLEIADVGLNINNLIENKKQTSNDEVLKQLINEIHKLIDEIHHEDDRIISEIKKYVDERIL